MRPPMLGTSSFAAIFPRTGPAGLRRATRRGGGSSSVVADAGFSDLAAGSGRAGGGGVSEPRRGGGIESGAETAAGAECDSSSVLFSILPSVGSTCGFAGVRPAIAISFAIWSCDICAMSPTLEPHARQARALRAPKVLKIRPYRKSFAAAKAKAKSAVQEMSMHLIGLGTRRHH